MSVPKRGEFEDFDNKFVYLESLKWARDQKARNFVVQFGKADAQIAFELNPEQFKHLLEEPVSPERPVRWM
jgi:hypothetical protein